MLFRFKEFLCQQSDELFKIGTDAVLLGCLVHMEAKTKILEVGTGTGIISLMLAQRNRAAQITAIDIDPKATELAEINFNHSVFKNQLTAICVDYNAFETNETFDLILSNPPYFEVFENQNKKISKQCVTLKHEVLISKSVEILSKNGTFWVVLPILVADPFIKMAHNKGLFLNFKVNITGILGGKVKRAVLGFSFNATQLKHSKMTIQKAPRQYSEAYLELTQDFHMFG